MIPCFINNFNRLAWPKAMVKEISRMGGFSIIVDNGSTYQPTLDWYSDLSIQYDNIVLLQFKENYGPMAPWLSGAVDAYAKNFYVVTDPDLDLSSCPDDTLDLLVTGLLDHPRVNKAGLSLRIDDLPVWLPNVETILWNERDFWKRKSEVPGWYVASIDTTFAMYEKHRPLSFENLAFIRAVRAESPYSARHLPWYSNPEFLSEEEKYYIDHMNKRFSFYSDPARVKVWK